MTRLFAGTPFDIPPRCEICDCEVDACECSAETKRQSEQQRQREADRVAPEKQTATVRSEKRKGNRRVTIVRGLTDRANDLPELLSHLKSACGCGGTLRRDEDTIEVQGDLVAAVSEALRDRGYRVHAAGQSAKG